MSWGKLMLCVGALILAAMVSGCGSQTCVVAQSTTCIGLDATYDQQTQTPRGRMGYVRAETAIVPTNKTPDCAYEKDAKDAKQGGTGGAADSPDVLIEFSFLNWFCVWKDQNIYQRMAVGEHAMKVAPYVFMRDGAGQFSLSKEAIANIQAVKTLNDAIAAQPAAQDVTVSGATANAAKAAVGSIATDVKKAIDQAAAPAPAAK